MLRSLLLQTLILTTSCNDIFTKKVYDSLPDHQEIFVEFLEYPKVRMVGVHAYYPVTVSHRVYLWNKDGSLKGTRIDDRVEHVFLPEALISIEAGETEEQQCFRFSVGLKSGNVGEAQYTPLKDCVRSIKQLRESRIQTEIFYNVNFWKRSSIHENNSGLRHYGRRTNRVW